MKLFLTVFLSSLLLLASCGGETQPPRMSDYPSLEEVVSRLTREYDIVSPVNGNHFFSLSRRPQGWFVQEEDQDSKILREQLYWSLEERTYQEVDLPAQQSPSQAEMHKKSIISSFGFTFQHNLFCNYPRWADDVIEALSPVDQPGDTALNQLARAYSGKASSFFAPGTQFSGDGQKWANQEHTEVSQTSADSGKYFVRQSIQTYKELMMLHPGFQTVVGPVKVKWANEYLFAWLELRMLNRAAESKEFMVDGLYDGVILSISKSILNSCPQNSILFVNGDNDTYPLLWAQEKLNFRKDVAVVNLSLLNTVGYVRYCRDLASGSQRIAFSRDVKGYYGLYSESYISASEVEIPAVPVSAPLPTEGAGTFVKPDRLPVRAKGHESPYFLNQDAALLDIIQSNWGSRPICFSTTVARSNFLGLDELLWQRGMVLQLLAAKGTQNRFGQVVMEDQHLETVKKEYDLSFLGESGSHEKEWFRDDPGIISLLYTFVPAFQLAADQKDQASLRDLSSTMGQILDLYPYEGSFMLEWMVYDVCGQAGQGSLAREWGDRCMKGIGKMVLLLEEKSIGEREAESERLKYILQQMMNTDDAHYTQQALKLIQKLDSN